LLLELLFLDFDYQIQGQKYLCFQQQLMMFVGVGNFFSLVQLKNQQSFAPEQFF